MSERKRYAYIPVEVVTAAHLEGTLCRQIEDLCVYPDGTAIIPWRGRKPRGLYGVTERTEAEHRAWLRARPAPRDLAEADAQLEASRTARAAAVTRVRQALRTAVEEARA